MAAGAGVQLASAATDDDLAFANFGLASSYLAADFYGKALTSGKLGPEARGWPGPDGRRRWATRGS